jgi:hypothetical protein
LEPYTNKIISGSEWPGTKMFDGSALLHFFEYSNATVSILEDFSSSLFQWLQPDLPEDLCLIRNSGDSWLTTISHESDGYLSLSQSEMMDLAKGVPGFELILNRDD